MNILMKQTLNNSLKDFKLKIILGRKVENK